AGTTFDIAAALANPESSEYQLLLRDIDAIAVQLQKAAAANIPILWRPLHESEGGWFWWGAKGPGPFKELWRLLHHRLTTHHALHNLIWVLTSEHPDWYPGDDVVDVIGVDAYPSNRSDALSSRWEPLLARFDGNKPIALTEFGGVPDIERMHRLGVFFAWFCSWTGPYGPTSEPDTKVARIYQSGAVLTLNHHRAWQLAHFSTDADDPAIAGDAANPDHDGLANLLEYALGTDPNHPNPSPVSWEFTGEDPALVITIPRDPAATGVTLEVESTANLADPASWTTAGVEILTDTPDLLIVRDSQPGPRRFFRLRATRNMPPVP
nr:glycoside hydrolase family 26 protein [Akkermansiaceae bacterium]